MDVCVEDVELIVYVCTFQSKAIVYYIPAVIYFYLPSLHYNLLNKHKFKKTSKVPCIIMTSYDCFSSCYISYLWFVEGYLSSQAATAQHKVMVGELASKHGRGVPQTSLDYVEIQ